MIINVNNKKIKFTAGSSNIIIDYKTFAMDNVVRAEIKEGRMFVHFGALGNILVVNVDWDTNTKTAVYKIK